MGRSTLVLPLALALLAASYHRLAAQQPGGNPFDGESTLIESTSNSLKRDTGQLSTVATLPVGQK